MAKLKVLQTNATSGVLDPALAAREDTVFYYNGLKDALNLHVIPQGGVTARPGLGHVARILPQLSEISLSGATVTAPEGGTAGNAHDGDPDVKLETANNLSTTNPFVVVHVDFGAPVAVAAADVLNYALESGALADEFFIQYSADNSAWSNFGAAFDWDAADRSRRRRDTSGTVTAQYWRVARIGATDIAAKAEIGLIRFWAETADLSAVRLAPFAYSTEEAYMGAVSDRNMDFYTGSAYACSAAMPHLSAQLPVINWTQRIDTMLFFHKDVAPERIFRQGADDEFDFRAQAFTNIPKYDYGAGTGGVNEVQVLTDGGTVASGDKFTILLDGERTTAITAAATRGDTATAIQTALRALGNTAAAGITVADAGGDGFTVTFGGDDGVQPWGEMTVSVLSGNSVWSVSRTTKGEYPGESIISNTRGWPRCGLFHQKRLVMGGFKGVPDAFLASVLGDYFNMDIALDTDERGLLFRAETDQIGAIYNIIAGRHLSLFTNDGEFYFQQEAISKDNPLKLSTRSGSKEGLRVFEVDGALVFVQGVKDEDSDREIGTSIREFLFVDTEQSYQANLISKLSGHLIKNPVDMALRKALSTNEADVLALINEDGTGTSFTMLRGDAVNAFMPAMTRAGDKLLAVGVDKKRRVFFAVERIINGSAVRYLEKWDENLLLDGGGRQLMEAQEFTATEGQTEFVWTFDNPADVAAIGVRIDGGRLEAADYTADLGTKTATLAEGVAAGTVVRVAKMVNEITGLGYLEGEEVLTVLDGTEGGAYTISSGTLSLDDYADTEIQWGFDFEVSAKLMPLRIPESETLSDEIVRCVNATFNLLNTGGLEFRANGRDDWQALDLQKFDTDVLDHSTAELVATGEFTARGLKGYAVGAPLEFRRPGPVPFTVLGVVREVSL